MLRLEIGATRDRLVEAVSWYRVMVGAAFNGEYVNGSP